VDREVRKISEPLTVAMMDAWSMARGSPEADIGSHGGKRARGFLFKKGRILRKRKEKDFARFFEEDPVKYWRKCNDQYPKRNCEMNFKWQKS